MPVDYSKWDSLELSDDSDIEVHPNVDKRSFIRAKQNQIHLERQQRRHHIEVLKYERVVNDGLLRRIEALLAALREHEGEAKATAAAGGAEGGAAENAASTDASAAVGAVAFRAVMESAAKLRSVDGDRPPKPPPGVHSSTSGDGKDGKDGQAGEPDSYSKMMAVLLDQVNKALGDRYRDDGAARYAAMQAEITGHRDKVVKLQAELAAKLTELEREEARKITSDSIHTGFDSSFVNKATAADEDNDNDNDNDTTELLNPGFASAGKAASAASATPKPKPTASTSTSTSTPTSASTSTPTQTQKTSAATSDDATPTASAATRQFAAFNPSNLRESMAFLSTHPRMLADPRQEEAMLLMAFDAFLDKASSSDNAKAAAASSSSSPPALLPDNDDARRYVHQAKLLEYCRSLGRDGVALFFKRITTPGHQARDMFLKDVQDTYAHVRQRSGILHAQKAGGRRGGHGHGDGADSDDGDDDGPGGVEQIQLHAVEPGTVITIRIPPVVPDDASVATDENGAELDAATAQELLAQARHARAVFEAFSPEMRKALESGSLDQVNAVLGQLPVPEAEELVAKFGEAGVLSLEEEIIDATTEQGRAQLKELGRSDFVDDSGVAKEDSGAAAPAANPKEEIGDPE